MAVKVGAPPYQYVSPSVKIVELIKWCSTPMNNAKPGEEVNIITDTAQDPNIWMALAGAASEKGCHPTISIMEPRPYHQADPTRPVSEAMKVSDINVVCTTKAMIHSRKCHDAWEAGRKMGIKVGFIIMEEVNAEILSTAGSLTWDETLKMHEQGKRIESTFLKAKKIHIFSEFGTDYTTEAAGQSHLVCGVFEERAGAFYGGRHVAWPDGEVGCGQKPDTGQGTIVYDTSVHHPPGLLKEPIKLTVEKGWCTRIEGGAEAQQFKDYISTYCDRNTFRQTEIAMGINPKAVYMGYMRADKKCLGSMHLALGELPEAKCHIDGIMTRGTFILDEGTPNEVVVMDKGEVRIK